MTLISTHNKRMPFWVVLDNLKKNDYNLTLFSDKCYSGEVIDVLKLSSNIYRTIKDKYPDKKNIAYIKNLQTSLLYLKKLEYEGYNIDFLTAGLLTKEKLSKYDLVILEGDVQDDNIFSIKDINIRYNVQGDNVIFKDNKELNCFYILQGRTEYKNPENATERACFTKAYISNFDNLKLDYKFEFEFKELKEKLLIYYYINQIRD